MHRKTVGVRRGLLAYSSEGKLLQSTMSLDLLVQI